jgi:hypothetical protein
LVAKGLGLELLEDLRAAESDVQLVELNFIRKVSTLAAREVF